MPIQNAPILALVDATLASLFERHPSVAWHHDWKLYVGWGLWASTWANWLLNGYTGKFHWKFVYTLGINLAALHSIQYNGHQGLLGVMVFLAFQTAGTTFVWWKDKDVLKKGHFVAKSVYEDLSTPLMQTCTVFVGQMCLIIFYVSSIFSSLRPDSLSYVFWLASFFCLQMAAFFNRGDNSQLGTTFCTSQWFNIINVAKHAKFSCNGYGGRTDDHSKNQTELVIRGVFAFVVNNIFRDILAFTIPILLSQFTSALDFVVYCVGVNFIVTIDDMEPKQFDVQLFNGNVASLQRLSTGSYEELSVPEGAPEVSSGSKISAASQERAQLVSKGSIMSIDRQYSDNA